MDALDVLDVGAKVGGVVDLVLKQDAGHLVSDKFLGLDLVGLGVEVVGLEGAGLQGENEVASRLGVRSRKKGRGKGGGVNAPGFELLVAGYCTPHF